MRILKPTILVLVVALTWGCGSDKKATSTAKTTTNNVNPVNGYNENGTSPVNNNQTSGIATIFELGNYQNDNSKVSTRITLDDQGTYYNYEGWLYKAPTSGFSYSFGNVEAKKSPLKIAQGTRNGFIAVTEKQYNGTTNNDGRTYMFFKLNGSSSYQVALRPSDLNSMAQAYGDSYVNLRNKLTNYFLQGSLDLNNFKSLNYPSGNNYYAPMNSIIYSQFYGSAGNTNTNLPNCNGTNSYQEYLSCVGSYGDTALSVWDWISGYWNQFTN